LAETQYPPDYYEQPQPPPAGPPPPYEPEPMPEIAQRWEYETDDILEKVREVFAGEKWNDKEKEWKKIRPDAGLCNSKGVEFVMSWLQSVMHRVTYLSNLSSDEVQIILSDLMDEVIGELACRYKEFDVKETSMSRFVLLIDIMLTCAIKKSQDDLERQHKNSVEQRKVVTQRIEEVGDKRRMGGLLG